MRIRVSPSTCTKLRVYSKVPFERTDTALDQDTTAAARPSDFSYFSVILSVMRCPDTDTCYNVTKNAFQKFFAMHDPLRF